MTEWKASHSRWLKSVGSADDPMAADWFEAPPPAIVHFAKKPASVRVGDLLVYYAAVHQKLLGIVEVFGPPKLDPTRERWAHFCEIRPRLVIRDLERAPSIDVLDAPESRDFRKVVQRMDYVVLSDDEYERALGAIENVWDDAAGDVRTRGFNAVRT